MSRHIPTGHHLSASSLALYEACPARYQYKYRLRWPEIGPDSRLEVGALVHAAIERASRAVLSIPGESGTVTSGFLADQLSEEAAARDAAPEVAAGATRVLEGLELDLVDTDAIEVPFERLELGAVLVGGIMDRVDLRSGPAGVECVVIDYKSGGPSSEGESVQALLYLAVARRLYPEADAWTFETRYLATRTEARVGWTPERDAEIRRRLATAWESIQREAFGATPGESCSSCPYRDRCPDLRAYLADADPTNPLPTTATLEELVIARQRLRDLAEIADVRRKDIDNLLRERLTSAGHDYEDVRGYRVRIKTRRQESIEQGAACLEALARVTRLELSTLIDAACTVRASELRRAIPDRADVLAVLDEYVSLDPVTYIEIRSRSE